MFCVGSEIKSCKHLPKSYALVNGLNYVVDTQQKKVCYFETKMCQSDVCSFDTPTHT